MLVNVCNLSMMCYSHYHILLGFRILSSDPGFDYSAISAGGSILEDGRHLEVVKWKQPLLSRK